MKTVILNIERTLKFNSKKTQLKVKSKTLPNISLIKVWYCSVARLCPTLEIPCIVTY